MAVIQLQTERLGVELIHERPTWLHHFERAIHIRRMDSVKVNGMRMRARIREMYANPITFSAPQRRARHLPVVRPRREVNARRNLDFLVERSDIVLAQRLSIRQRRYLAVIELGQELRWIEPVRVDLTNRIERVRVHMRVLTQILLCN